MGFAFLKGTKTEEVDDADVSRPAPPSSIYISGARSAFGVVNNNGTVLRYKCEIIVA